MFDVITIGTAVRDAFVEAKQFAIIKDNQFKTKKGLAFPLGGKIDVGEIFFSTGGGGTNTAVTFARQGFETACLCRVGNDISGKAVIEDLRKDNVADSLVQIKKEEKTGYSIILLTPEGERTVLVFRGASATFPSSDMPDMLEAKWFYLGGSLSLELVEKVLARAQKIGAKVAMAPSKVHFELGLAGLGEILKKVSLITMNREEASSLTGVPYDKEKEIFSRLDSYVQNIVVMTEGAKGVMVSDGKSIYRAGIFKEKKLVDRTGAGDAFGSGFVASLARNDNLVNLSEQEIKRAIRLASANATSVVEKLGAKTGILTKEDFTGQRRWDDLDVRVESLV